MRVSSGFAAVCRERNRLDHSGRWFCGADWIRYVPVQYLDEIRTYLKKRAIPSTDQLIERIILAQDKTHSEGVYPARCASTPDVICAMFGHS